MISSRPGLNPRIYYLILELIQARPAKCQAPRRPRAYHFDLIIYYSDIRAPKNVYVTFLYFRSRASFSLSFDAGPAKPAVPSSGGLKRRRFWWLDNCSDKWVLQWVQHGFPLFWSFLPSQAPRTFFRHNNKEALACSGFVTSSILTFSAQMLYEVAYPAQMCVPLERCY